MELSVIVVNYNAQEYLKNCLSSLFEHTDHRPLQVLVVDNASSDGSLEMLKSNFPDVRVIALPTVEVCKLLEDYKPKDINAILHVTC